MVREKFFFCFLYIKGFGYVFQFYSEELQGVYEYQFFFEGFYLYDRCFIENYFWVFVSVFFQFGDNGIVIEVGIVVCKDVDVFYYFQCFFVKVIILFEKGFVEVLQSVKVFENLFVF